MPLSLKIFIVSILALVVAFVVNMMRSNTLPPYTEYVLTDGMKITAKMPQETIVIRGGKGTRRFFKGESWSKTADLTPITKRMYGSLGLYDPAESYTQDGRLMVWEGRQFFSSKHDAMRFLCYIKNLYDLTKEIRQKHYEYVYTNSGLVIAYEINRLGPHEIVRSIDIWQIYINGKKPTSLEGTNDSAIQVTGGVIPETATPHPAEEGEPQQLCPEDAMKH